MTTKDTPVIIVGPVGAGKTTLGQELSVALHLPFIDVDQIAAQKLGESIASAMITRPDECEATQRKLAIESLVTLENQPSILALPPAASTNDEVTAAILQAKKFSAFVIEITIDVAELSRRMGLNGPRTVQLGAPRAMLAKMLERTHQHHKEFANVSVTTVGHHIDQVLQEVLSAL